MENRYIGWLRSAIATQLTPQRRKFTYNIGKVAVGRWRGTNTRISLGKLEICEESYEDHRTQLERIIKNRAWFNSIKRFHCISNYNNYLKIFCFLFFHVSVLSLSPLPLFLGDIRKPLCDPSNCPAKSIKRFGCGTPIPRISLNRQRLKIVIRLDREHFSGFFLTHNFT